MTTPSSSATARRSTTVEVRLLDRPEEMSALIDVFARIWPSDVPMASVELLRSVAHVGGYVAGAFDEGALVGGSFGFLARHDGRSALHSHVTGVLDTVRDHGIGRRLKSHQRRWAADRGIDVISWTFDPLVRRNAWFNIAVLGAEARSYHVDFYGPMGDALNAGDESDRLLVLWPTAERTAPSGRPTASPGASQQAVSTPEDIVALRHRDPDAARAWRIDLRHRLMSALDAGGRIIGFSAEGDYLIDVPALDGRASPGGVGDD